MVSLTLRPGRLVTLFGFLTVIGCLWLLTGSGKRPTYNDIYSLPGLRTWRGWQNIEYMFVFGDSWSTIEFDPKGTQPTREIPWGNPDDPTRDAEISSNGPNWVMYLTDTHNQSFVRTYDLAHGAATVSRSIRPPHPLLNHTFTFEEQVQNIFEPLYSTKPFYAPWKSGNTLFVTWCGTVDIVLSVREGLDQDIDTKVAIAYETMLNKLYVAGARNFLLMLMPPMHLGPSPEQDVNLTAKYVLDINSKLLLMRHWFLEKHPKIKFFVFDTNSFFLGILNDPKIMEQTAQIKNTTDYCEDYNPKTPALDTFIPKCGIPVDQYFWINPLHTTHPVHNALAAAIVRDCLGKETQGFCTSEKF